MLKSLSITNYALIDELHITFDDGFSVVTGETGAGKSIILGALSLIMGARNDSSTLLDPEKKCVVESLFNVKGYGFEPLFKENDIDYEPLTTLRREALPGGKTRAFINDTPVNLNILKLVAERLIDVHSQHQNLLISNSKFQLEVVDSVAKTDGLVENYRIHFASYKRLVVERKELIEQIERQKADEEYMKFQYDQLVASKLQENEQVELELELERLSHVEEVKAGMSLVLNLLQGEDSSVLPKVKETQLSFKRISRFVANGEEYQNRLEALYLELKDISADFDGINSKMEFEPQRLTYVSERLAHIYSLHKKHHVGTVAELLAIEADLLQRLKSIEGFDAYLEQLDRKIELCEKEAYKCALELSKARTAVFDKIESRIISQLRELAIPNAEFKVFNEPTKQMHEDGVDKIEFLFSANKNGKLGDISKVASGGEISRVMLCIKALISDVKALPTIIFDEIDTGVSGEVASKMGSIMEDMSKQIQVVSITHLPQIACKGHQHFKVFKTDNEHFTRTSVKTLSFEERVVEIAKMVSGKELSEAALTNARELLVGKG